MNRTAPSDLAEQFKLRLPPHLKAAVASKAKEAQRSMNAEIIAMIEKAISDTGEVEQLRARISALEDAVFGPTGRHGKAGAA